MELKDYNGKKIFIIEYDLWRMRVSIDFESYKVKEKIKEMVEFWVEWEDKLSICNNDYVLTFFRMLGCAVIEQAVNWSTGGIIKYFNNAEGWYPLNGSYGITILNVNYWNWKFEEFTVKMIS